VCDGGGAVGRRLTRARGACDIIEAKGLAQVSPEIPLRLDKIIGTLVNITK